MGDEVPTAHVIDVKSKEGEQVMAAKASEGKELGTSMVVQAEGLEFETLATLDKVYIQQKTDTIEALAQQLGCGCVEYKNTYYVIHPETFETLLEIKEESGMLQRCLCKPGHSVHLDIKDVRTNTTAMTAHKPCKCLCCCAFLNICQAEMQSFTPEGEMFAYSKVPRGGGGFTPTLEVMDRSETVHSVIKGPFLITGGLVECCGEFTFNMFSTKGKQTNGVIQKLKPGSLNRMRSAALGDKNSSSLTSVLGEAFTDADSFVLHFPENQTNEMKMGMLSNAILIDYLFYERGGSADCSDGSLNICDLYCCGCICPCTIEASSGGGE